MQKNICYFKKVFKTIKDNMFFGVNHELEDLLNKIFEYISNNHIIENNHIYNMINQSIIKTFNNTDLLRENAYIRYLSFFNGKARTIKDFLETAEYNDNKLEYKQKLLSLKQVKKIDKVIKKYFMMHKKLTDHLNLNFDTISGLKAIGYRNNELKSIIKILMSDLDDHFVHLMLYKKMVLYNNTIILINNFLYDNKNNYTIYWKNKNER